MAGLDSRVCSPQGLSWGGGPNMAQWTVWGEHSFAGTVNSVTDLSCIALACPLNRPHSAIKIVISYVFVFSLPMQTETDGGSEARPGTPKKISEETVQSESDVS